MSHFYLALRNQNSNLIITKKNSDKHIFKNNLFPNCYAHFRIISTDYYVH